MDDPTLSGTIIEEHERKINTLEQQVAALRELLRKKEQGARQGLLQIVASIEEFQGTEPRTADLRKEAKRGRIKSE